MFRKLAGRGFGLAATLAMLLAPSPLHADTPSLIFGESIHVGPDDTLGQVYCVACSIYIEGEVDEAAFLVLGRLENRGKIHGEAMVVLGSLESFGEIDGNSTVIAGNMRLHSKVGGDAISALGDIRAVSPDARIEGDAITYMGRQSGLTPSSVAGTIEQVGGNRLGLLALGATASLVVFGALLALAVVLALNVVAYLILGTERVQTLGATLNGNSTMCFLGGLVTCLVMSVIALVVSMLLPVFVPMMVMFVAVSVVGYCGVTYWIGRNVFRRLSAFTATVAATVLLALLQMIPVIGWLVMLVLWTVAIGATVLSGFGTSPTWLFGLAGKQPWQQRPAG